MDEPTRIAGPAIDIAPNPWFDDEDPSATISAESFFQLWTIITAPAGLADVTTYKIGGVSDPNFPFPRSGFEERVPGVLQSFFSTPIWEEEIGETIVFRIEAEDELGQKTSVEIEIEVIP